MAGEGGLTGVGQQFSGAEILVLTPGAKHIMVQCTCSNEVEKRDFWPKANPVEGDQDIRDHPKSFSTFPERSRGMNCEW